MPSVSSLLRHRLRLLNAGPVPIAFLRNESYLTSIHVLSRVGSSAESPDRYGIAHILEHMFFKGSRKRPGGTAIPRAANDIGAFMNAYTSYDHTAYYITTLNDTFNEAFDILADMYRNPLFPEEEFRKELNPILSEFREREDDPDDFIHERAMEECYGAAYHPIIGTEQSIQSATTADMHSFKNRFYGAGNTILVVVGGVDEDHVVQTALKHFADLPAAEHPEYAPLTQKAGNLELTKTGIQEAYFNLYFPALPENHPDRFKEDLMNFILGGSDSSLLFERIRDELGLSSYGVYSMISRNEPFNSLNISCGIDPDEVPVLGREVNDIIKRMCDDPMEEHHLSRARASIRMAIASRSETSKGLASMVALPVLHGETEDPAQKALAALEEITAEDVMLTARRAFSGPCFRAVLMPEDE